MQKERVEKMRAFIIQFVFYSIILCLIFISFKLIVPLFAPFLIAFGIAFLLKPVIDRCTIYNPAKRKLISVLTLCAFYLIVLTLLIVVGTRLIILLRGAFYALPEAYANIIEPSLQRVQLFVVQLIDGLNPDAVTIFNEITAHLNTAMSGFVSEISSRAVSALGNAAVGVPATLIGTIVCIVASFFFVADYAHITNFIVCRLSSRGKRLLFRIKAGITGVLVQFGKAYALLMSITFLELLAGLLLLRVPNAFLLALLIAAVDILPVLGTGTIVIPWALICFILGNFRMGIGLSVLYAVITIVRQSLEPRIVGKQIGLHPLVTLAGMFVGASLFGFLGLFGVPILITVFVQLERDKLPPSSVLTGTPSDKCTHI